MKKMRSSSPEACTVRYYVLTRALRTGMLSRLKRHNACAIYKSSIDKCPQPLPATCTATKTQSRGALQYIQTGPQRPSPRPENGNLSGALIFLGFVCVRKFSAPTLELCFLCYVQEDGGLLANIQAEIHMPAWRKTKTRKDNRFDPGKDSSRTGISDFMNFRITRLMEFIWLLPRACMGQNRVIMF